MSTCRQKCNIAYMYMHLIKLNVADKLYVYPCEWNYRPDHCIYRMVCNSARENGASVVHGIRSAFHQDKHPAFKTLYLVMLKVSLA